MAGTYADAIKQLKDAGLYDQTSQYDKNLLSRNPAFANNIVKNKTAYMNATSDAERQSANNAMNADRAYYGGYTGGTAGMDYNPTGNNTYGNTNLNGTPGTWSGEPSQNSTNPYGDYNSEYQTALNRMLGQPYESKVFRYNYKSDPTYKGMLEAYTKNGEIAGKNTLARLAAATGGAPSTYAVQAATAAQAQEMNNLANYIPQLQQNAWNMYVNDRDYNADQYRQRLNAITDLENRDYNRFVNANDTAYSRGRDEVGDQRYNEELAHERQREAAQDELNAQDRAWTWAQRYVQMGGDPAYAQRILEQYTGNPEGSISAYQQSLLEQQMAQQAASGSSGGGRRSSGRRRSSGGGTQTTTPTQNGKSSLGAAKVQAMLWQLPNDRNLQAMALSRAMEMGAITEQDIKDYTNKMSKK